MKLFDLMHLKNVAKEIGDKEKIEEYLLALTSPVGCPQFKGKRELHL
jgi:hypothetical protein